jgi:hypothetical protein
MVILVGHVKHHQEMTEHYRNQLAVVHFQVQVLTYVWASSKCEYEWYTPTTTA